MTVSVALFTSDLRVHDNPVLRAAVRDADAVVALFVRDKGIHRAGFDAPNRRAFLADCLADLDAGLRRRGGRLVVRDADVVAAARAVVVETGARSLHIAGGVSGYAMRREARLHTALALSAAPCTSTTRLSPRSPRAGSSRRAVITTRCSPRTSAVGRRREYGEH